jgi:hypothetical protein
MLEPYALRLWDFNNVKRYKHSIPIKTQERYLSGFLFQETRIGLTFVFIVDI